MKPKETAINAVIKSFL